MTKMKLILPPDVDLLPEDYEKYRREYDALHKEELKLLYDKIEELRADRDCIDNLERYVLTPIFFLHNLLADEIHLAFTRDLIELEEQAEELNSSAQPIPSP